MDRKRSSRHHLYLKIIASVTCSFALILLTVQSRMVHAASVTMSPGQSCTSAGCHEEFGKAPHVHPAMEDGECSGCHEQQGDEHSFLYTAEGNDLCYICHEQFGEKKVQHDALELGCTSCHNPHESKTEHLLQADSLSSLCFTCHDDSILKHKWTHGPAEAGECMICHKPHESDNTALLVEPVPQVCYTCHSEIQENLSTEKVTHPPAEEECTLCHDPHGQEQQFNLLDAVPELCYGCHGDIEEFVTTAVVKHGVVEKDKRCLNCHMPHSSKFGNLLNVNPSELCYRCHDKSVETAEGKKLLNIKEWVEGRKYPHGPVVDKECAACHQPHGSKFFMLLKEQYPDRSYAAFSEESYALCFMCHESKAFLYERTTKLTDFRDGSRNLHYLHVNKPYKGRVCTVCHDAHATDNPKHLKETTMFGTWQMPIRFKETKAGGSCYPGCHKLQEYDRLNSVVENGKVD